LPQSIQDKIKGLNAQRLLFSHDPGARGAINEV
jgi:hypothetical protein